MRRADVTQGANQLTLPNGINVGVGYDGFLRRQSLQATRNAVTLTSQTYGYDALSRPETVINGSQTITFGYTPLTTLLNTTTFTNGTAITRSYDSVGRLETIATTTPAAGLVASYTYTYNSLNQRTRARREDNSYWSYAYNDRSELVSGKKYWADDSPVAGQQTEYAFDSLGNRVSTKTGGDSQGLQLRDASFTANSLNQYQQRTVPGAVDVLGTANDAATVTVNNQATTRRGQYFYKEWIVDNTSSPVYVPLNVFAIRSGVGPNGEDAVMNKDGHAYVPRSIEPYGYDPDGNLTSDGRWNYTWDAENRLRSMQAVAAAPVEARKRLEFVYDYMGRRVQKKVYNWNAGTGAYQLQSTTKFVHDGWNLVAELDGSNNLQRNYVWSPTGLLSINEGTNTYIAAVDGNQNVVALIKSNTGNTAAVYDYDPSGQTIISTGEYAAQNPFKFSSQYTDSETGLLCYGYRYYNPGVGRWINRDPIAESGGPNLYQFVYNNAPNAVDELGAKTFSEYAEEKMWDLLQNHAHEVGSEFQGNKAGRQDTNCTIYVTNVLEYAFEKIGRKDIANQIHGMQRSSGIDIATLLQSQGWKGHYWNPDVREPRNNASPRNPDGSLKYGIKEHTTSYQTAVKFHTYGLGKIRVDGFIVNYALTSHRTRTIRRVTPVVVGATVIPMPGPSEEFTPQDNMGAL